MSIRVSVENLDYFIENLKTLGNKGKDELTIHNVRTLSVMIATQQQELLRSIFFQYIQLEDMKESFLGKLKKKKETDGIEDSSGGSTRDIKECS